MMSSARSLYRQMLSEAKRIKHYNVREYALRRVKIGFEENRGLTGSEASAAYEEGVAQLGVLRRQAAIYNMYPTEASVMEHDRTAIPHN
ncbi:hypothetical protein CTAYLR_009966 [Chrysophaeum taylorii]|uniref:Complex 1 LYR protein domain-containing protein n=1 Tax=Chrysophaeum taylorii TaxID=2483200 RepID=A0AAD7U5V6_9STRA|nr:hypothetical protein CTAYLR_009966 [Chrysophaeum taylorii]